MKKGKSYYKRIMNFNQLIKPFTKKEKKEYEAQESCYRRGYRHGYDQVTELQIIIINFLIKFLCLGVTLKIN